MTVSRGLSIAVLVLAAVFLSAACEDSSPGGGEACTQSGGVCVATPSACAGSLPFPCPNDQTCCSSVRLPGDAGGGHD